MLPLIESRNYQRFVIDYMGRLVTRHSSSASPHSVSHNEYLKALDAIYAPHGTVPAKLVDELNQHGRTLKVSLKPWNEVWQDEECVPLSQQMSKDNKPSEMTVATSFLKTLAY